MSKKLRRMGRAIAASFERRDPLEAAQRRAREKAAAKRANPADQRIPGQRSGFDLPPSLGGQIRWRPDEKPPG